MRRREFITLVGGPFAARAQQAKVPTIGALVIGNINPELMIPMLSSAMCFRSARSGCFAANCRSIWHIAGSAA